MFIKIYDEKFYDEGHVFIKHVIKRRRWNDDVGM